MEVVVVLVIAALALRGISKPFVALLALLVVYIVQPGELYPHLAVLHLERMLAIFTLVSFFLHGNRFIFPPITKWFLAFYGAMLASIPLAFWRGNSVGFCIFFLEIVFFHLLIVALLTSEERVKQFIITNVALVGWLAATALFMYETGHRMVAMGIERASGLTSAGGDPNTLGLTLVCTLPLDLLLMAKDNAKWIRLLGLVVCVVSIVTVIVTGSRTSFFGMLFMVLLLFIADWKRKLKFLPILLVALPLLWLAVPQQYKARYETVDNLKSDDSYQNRVLSWQGGVQMFLHNPITGVGPDNYTDANGSKYWPGKGQKHWLNAHSLYFKLLGELGLLGVITFFGYLFQLFRLNHRLTELLKDRGVSRMLQKYPLHCQMCLCLLLFAGYSQHNTYRSQWFIFGAISAAVACLQTEKTSAAVLAPANAKKKRPVGAWVPGAEPATLDALSIQYSACPRR
jgi:O-antigen ligase